jgi:hypothetical protein
VEKGNTGNSKASWEDFPRKLPYGTIKIATFFIERQADAAVWGFIRE